MPRPQTKHIRQENCDLLHEAFRIYREQLEAVIKEHEPNEAITSELSLVKFLLPQFFEEPRNHGGVGTFTLDDDVWAFIKDVGEKYLRARREQLHLKELSENIKGATAAEFDRLEDFRYFLSELAYNGLPKRPALIKQFNLRPPAVTSETEQKLNIQVQVGNVYGNNVAVAGINSGDVTMGATGSELEKLLETLSEAILKASSITNEQRTDALGDINTIRAQAAKAKPDKGIIKKAAEALKLLASAEAVGTSAVTLAPHIEHLGHLIAKLLN